MIRINVLIDDFDKYYGEATDDLRNIPALAHLSDTLEVRTPGSLRTSDNVTTLKQCGTVLISGGKIFAAIPEKIIATVYKGNIIKNLIMDCQSYTKYRPNETTGGIFVSWRRKEELPTGA